MMNHHIRTIALAIGLALTHGLAASETSRGGPVPEGEDAVRVKYRHRVVHDIRIFYREAGTPGKPVLLLLHGFPSSSHMYRELLPLLARDFHLIAPDYPGAGFSDYPSAEKFTPTFSHLTEIMAAFVEQLGLSSFVIYMQDFGGPVGFRMARQHPERVQGLVIQNANAYLEGIAADQLKGIMTPQRSQAEQLVTRAFTLFQYKTGARQPDAMDPTSWSLDAWILENPDVRRIQTELMLDYRSNVSEYPQWQAYLRKAQPKTLILWGRNDPIFLPSGAQAYLRDLPNAQLRFFDAGHFALEEEAPAIASEIRRAFATK